MAGFEYLTEALKTRGFIDTDELDQDALDQLLDERGEDGWELVQVLQNQNLRKGRAAHVLIFKRALDD
jgi:hypothetical protein